MASTIPTHIAARRHRRGPGELRGRAAGRRRHRERTSTRLRRLARSPAAVAGGSAVAVAALIGARPGLTPTTSYLAVAAALTFVAVGTIGRAPWARAMAAAGVLVVLGDATLTTRSTPFGPTAAALEGTLVLVGSAALLPRGGALRFAGVIGTAIGGALGTSSSPIGMTLVVPVALVVLLVRAGPEPGRYARRRGRAARAAVGRIALGAGAAIGWWFLVRRWGPGTRPSDPLSLSDVGNAFQAAGPSAKAPGVAGPYSLFADAMSIVGGFGVIPLAVALAVLTWGAVALWHVSVDGSARRGFAVAAALSIGVTATTAEAVALLGATDLADALVPAVASCAMTPILLLCGAVARPDDRRGRRGSRRARR